MRANTHSLHHLDIAGHGIALLRSVAEAWSRHRRLEKARAELSAYTDHELTDLGITRADIDRAVETGRRTLV